LSGSMRNQPSWGLGSMGGSHKVTRSVCPKPLE
jgi:hypothetical protein